MYLLSVNNQVAMVSLWSDNWCRFGSLYRIGDTTSLLRPKGLMRTSGMDAPAPAAWEGVFPATPRFQKRLR